MSFLEQKSIFNIESAMLLIEKQYYAPSVHCAYYGCYQYMVFFLKGYFKKSYEELDNECRGKDSHNYIIDLILSVLSKKIDTRSFIETKRNLKDLKSFRKISDYKNIQIISNDAEKSLAFSKGIIKTIKENTKK